MYDNSIYKIPAGVYFDTDGNRHIEVAERWSLSDNQLYDSMSDTNESVSTEGGRSYTFKDVVIYTMFSVGVIIALCGLGVLCLVRFFKGGPDISNEPY
jgi:hypothetical protein